MRGWYYTGGWVGSTDNNGRVRSFDSCKIENYTVLGNNIHTDSAVGGWIGINDNGNSTVILSNVAMLDCDVKGSEFDATDKYGIGGFVGRHKGIIKGYNGLIKNLRLTADDRGVAGLNYTTISKSYHGAVIGANMDNAWCNVRIAGLSVQADDGYTIYDDWDSRRPAKGTSQSPNLNYVIHADTLGSSLSDTLHSYTFSGFTDGATNVSYTENSANPAVGSLRTVDTISSTTVNGVTRSTHNRAFSLTDPVSSEINNQKTTSGSTTTIVSQKNYFDNFPFNYPYVTSSPFTMIGETAFITGDGVRICGKSTDSNGELVLTLPADSISAASGTTLATDITNYNAKKSMFSTYETEIGSLPDGCQDFPVIVTDGNNVTDLNNLIDSYIRVLTQAGDDMDTLSGLKFNTTNASNSTYKDLVFQIAVRKIVYRDGNFEDDGAAQGLTLDSRGFRVNIRYPDNGNTPQFTLIDVQFFNPVTPSEVAYHLYVPVLVKKLIKFNCVTSSLPSAYYGEAQFGTQNPSVCALGTPVTFYARYTYQNTIQDWQNALNVGDSLMWHYNKQITLTMGANIDLMPEGTRMILVDKNLNDKAFYGTGSYTAQDGIFTKSVESNGDHTLTVDLSKFKSQEDDTTLHGDSVQDFGERIVIKAIKYEDATTEQKEAAQVTYITTQDQSIAYARATEVGETESGYYTIYNESDYTESNQPQRYILLIDEGNDSTAVLPLTETYYLTFFTDKSDTELRILTAQSAQTLSTSTVASHPSRRDDTSNHSNPTSLILGDLFQQVFNYFVTDAKQIDGDTGLINQQKKYVDAMISTTISFKDNEDVTKALPYISSNSVKLYHCFLIKMTKNDGFTTETTITGNPTIESADNKPEFSGYQTIYQSKSIHYSGITTTNSGQASYCNSAVFSASPPNGKNYILLTETNGSGELLDIKKLLLENGSKYTATISRNIRITYENKSDRDNQFPSRSQKGLSDTTTINQIGTMFTAYSNLDTDKTNIAQSNTTQKREDETTAKYHTNDDTLAEMTYNAVKDTEHYYNALGINQLDDADDFTQTIIAEGHYDATSFLPALSAEKIRFVLTMDQKQKNSSNNIFTYTGVKMSDYVIGNVTDGDGHTFTENADGSYELTLDYDSGMAATDITTIYQIKTDSDLRNVTGGIYSNYMVNLYVYLYDADDALIPRSDKNDYIVFTNAKVNPSFIRKPTSP